MNSTINLVFSLPNMVINKIYEYDNTYHHKYNTNNFKKELENMYMKIQIKQCKYKVIGYILSIIDNECIWFNEYGYIGNDDLNNLKKKRLEYKNENDFDVYIHPYNDGINYFKVLPKGKIEKWYNISSLKKSYRFDGYFCHVNNDSDNLLDLYNTSPDNLTGYGWVGSIEEGYYYDPYLHTDICMFC
jgi:hypothetical protein